jgi:hypothetical protein
MLDRITVHGARQHNLKNIDVEIPRNTFTVVTGLHAALPAGDSATVWIASGLPGNLFGERQVPVTVLRDDTYRDGVSLPVWKGPEAVDNLHP